MTGQMDITKLEKVWEEYYTGGDVVVGWLADRAGVMLQEIRVLRTQVEGLQAELEEERRKSQESEFDYMMDVEV